MLPISRRGYSKLALDICYSLIDHLQTLSAIQSFFLAMAKYPESQRKAQAELDAIIGPHRLPELSDRPLLPYVNALVKETMRWQLIAPLGKLFYFLDAYQERS